MRVLLADDERLLADTVAQGLCRLAIAVDVCYDGEAATDRLSVNRYDVAVLDRDMPKASGDTVCRWMVDTGLGTRILILTAASGIRDYENVDALALSYGFKLERDVDMPANNRTLVWRRLSLNAG